MLHGWQAAGMRPFAADVCSMGAGGSAAAIAAVRRGSVGAWNAMLTVWCLAHTSRCSWVHDWSHEHAPCPRAAEGRLVMGLDRRVAENGQLCAAEPR